MKKLTPLLFALMMLSTPSALAFTKGIYVTQYTLENTRVLQSLIRRSRATGINTFVVDLSRRSRRYDRNIKLVENNGLHYVVRIVVFPHGASRAQVRNKNFWQRKNKLIQHAITLGADTVQLDYIRYHTGHRPSSQNAKDIRNVIAWFRARVRPRGIPLQIAVFGEVSFKPSRSIGQNVRVFAGAFDSLAPMLYPSHYEPYRRYSSRPYKTVYDSLQAIKSQFGGKPPFSIYAYIEMSNYRVRMSSAKKQRYIWEQMRAARNAGVNGWYAWSPNNKYRNLFRVLQNHRGT